MKPSFRDTCIEANRLFLKGIRYPEIAKRLKLSMVEQAYGLVKAGELVRSAESYKLTADELLVMQAVTRSEVRAIVLDTWPPKTREVDFAAGKRPGWCARVVDARLRLHRDGEQIQDHHRFGLVCHIKSNSAGSRSGTIWLTPAGWAFAWDLGWVFEDWTVPS